MAGLSEKGLEIKRLIEVLSDMREDAQPIFQDLVPPDDVVDTSDSSTLGRLIALLSVPIADLWEATQEVYLAFDPNSAMGIALDNLVMYAGLSRNPASATTATVVVWGDESTFIPIGATVRALDNTLYDITIGTDLTRSQCIGFIVDVPVVVTGEEYKIDIGIGTTTINISHTASPTDTPESVLESLFTQMSAYPSLITQMSANHLVAESADIYDYLTVTMTNVVVLKIKARTEVRNQVVGAKTQEASTITAIATPMLGWDSVNNPFPAVVGENEETDSELRIRFRDSKFLRAQNISDALYSGLLDVDGVRYVGIFENETGDYDPIYDLPEHSFKPIVLGGNPTEIARVIWNNKPLGIASQGNTIATIFDSQGFQREIHFDRPENIDIYITMELTTDSNEFPANGADQIKSALIEYFQTTFSIGEDIIYSRLYTPINSVPGHQVDSLLIGIDPGVMGTVNIDVPYNGIASLGTNNITINIS